MGKIQKLLWGISLVIILGSVRFSSVNAAETDGLSVSVNSLQSTGVAIDANHFPDEIFRQYVSQKFDKDSDGILTEAEIADAKTVYVNYSDIETLDGIEYLVELTELYCMSNQIQELDVSKNTKLVELNCYDNYIPQLDLTKNVNLVLLNCAGNQIQELDLSGSAALTKLSCHENQIQALNLQNNVKLEELNCADNQIRELDVTNNPALKSLHCANNRIQKMDLSKNVNLTGLTCTNNELTALDLTRNQQLDSLACAENLLKELDLSANTKLTYLDCHYNQLKVLNLSACAYLTEVYCADNQLTELDLQRATELLVLQCGKNQIKELNLSNNTKLLELFCGGNQIQELNLSNCNIVKLWIVGNAIPYVNLSQDFTDGTSNWFDNHDETQAITIAGNTLDLSAHEDFNPAKVIPINNMTIEGKVITIIGEYGGYYYDMGYGHKLKVLVGKDDTTQKINEFVSRMYTVALNRDAETAGQLDWSNQLINQEIDGAGIANGFINSVEFKNRNLSNSDFLDTLYQTFFNRAADEDGKNNWMTFLNNGGSRNEVLAGFVNSREFSNLCDNYGIARGTMQADGSSIYKPGVRNYVLRMYTVALNRDGETLGVEDWSNRINTGAMNPEEVAKSFFNSIEFLNRDLSNEDYVETLYETFMDRASDPAGKADWVGRLNAGVSRQEVLEGFSRSPEFGNIMKSYGL
ncbi:MAG: DUF4214 domain-containing protein [Lachnospiraceae bacterium]|nr:DUF4214 domain-containing protein [Lachnospiraceae bacterium]